MAQKVQVILIDDTDGGEADETVMFAIDGVQYEIDLSATNAEALREKLDPYAKHARKVGGRQKAVTRRTPSVPAPQPRRDVADLRAWARDNGYTISDRGRVPASIEVAFKEATQS